MKKLNNLAPKMKRTFALITVFTILFWGCKKDNKSTTEPIVKLDAASLELTGRWSLNSTEWDPNADGNVLLSPVADFPCIANSVFDLNIDGTYLDQNLSNSICYLKPAPINGIFFITPTGKKVTGKWVLNGKTVLFSTTDSLGVLHKYTRTLLKDNTGFTLSSTDTLTYPGKSYHTRHYKKN